MLKVVLFIYVGRIIIREGKREVGMKFHKSRVWEEIWLKYEAPRKTNGIRNSFSQEKRLRQA